MPVTDPTMHGMIVYGSDDQPPYHARRIPLTGVAVEARITGPTSRVKLRQSYRNDSETPVEATYVFPLEEGAALCGFRVTIDDEILEGRVESSEKAFEEYDDAMAEGKTAFLIDQERPDVFTASVGNLLPKQELTIELEYVAEVPHEGNALRWRLPTTVSPRYIPNARRDAKGMDDAERITPPTTSAALPYRLQLLVEADLGTPLKSVESPSHKTRVEIDGARARVELAGDEGLMDRDFVLLLHPKEALAPVSGIQKGPAVVGSGPGEESERGEGDQRRDLFAGVSFVPEYAYEREPVEMVFVVDCSGSMGGHSTKQARKTLRLCLRSLEKGDRFNIIRFGSTHELYKKKSVDYDDESLKKVDEWVQRMDADLGGTEMLTPLAAAYQLPAIEGTRRRIVLITDGQVGNEDEIIRLAQQHAEEVAVFAFGVGYGASEHLVKGAARAGRGSAEMVYPGESIDEKVLRHFHRMTGRMLKDVKLSWEGVEVEDVLPREMPPVWAGEAVSFFGRVKKGDSGRAVLSFVVGGEEMRFVAEVSPAVREQDRNATPDSAHGTEAAPALTPASAVLGAVPTLWARRRIRELEEGPDWTGRQGSQQSGRKAKKLEKKRQEVEAQLVELGKQFGLVSAATSYVLIDEREDAERAETRATYVRVPGQLTRGWGGTPDFMMGSSELVCGVTSADTGSLQLLGGDEMPDWVRKARMSTRMGISKATAKFSRSRSDTVSHSAPPVRRPDPVDALAMEITADGYWEHSPVVFEVTGLTKRRVRELAGGLEIDRGEELVATLAVIVAVERNFLDVPAQWKPLLKKARKWVGRTTAGIDVPSGGSWEAWFQGAEAK